MKHTVTPSYQPGAYVARAMKMLRYMGDCSNGEFKTTPKFFNISADAVSQLQLFGS